MQLFDSSLKMQASVAGRWLRLRDQHRLTGGIALLSMALVLSACGGSDPSSVGSAAQGADNLTAAAPITFRDETFAGKTSNPNLFAAVVTHAGGVEAYFCDGAKDFWFRGLASDSAIEMSEASGGKLVVEVTNDVAVGRLTVGDVETTFEIPKAASDALYRADTYMGQQRILAGWIKLPNGEQRGVIRNGAVRLPSTLDTSNIVAPAATCTECASFVGALKPAPFSPEAALLKRNVAQEFTVIGLGDSFMSGEGAPVSYGNFLFNPIPVPGLATPIIQAAPEVWSSGLPTSRGQRNFNLTTAQRTRLEREARACHRGAAGLGLAVDALRQTWPNTVELIHQTFACSGASVKHLVNTTYSGPAGCGRFPAEIEAAERDLQREADKFPIVNLIVLAALKVVVEQKKTSYNYCKDISDDTDTYSIRAQVPEASDFLRAQRLKADAVVMSIGGNDIGFGTIIGDCLAPTNDCSKPGSGAQKALNDGKEALPAAYRSLAASLTATGIISTNTFLTSHPNPLSKNDTRTCAGTDFLPDALLINMSDNNAAFGVAVVGEINTVVRAANRAHGWQPITSHINSATGRGMCSTAPWYNTRNAALSQQGEDIPSSSEGVAGPMFDFFSVLPLFGTFKVELSAGMFHPNQAGQREGYMPAYRDSLNTALTTRFTPQTPTRFRPGAVFADGSINLVWDDVNDFESKTIIRNTANGQIIEVPADRTAKVIELNGALGSFTAKACFVGPGNRDICSPETLSITVEAKAPGNTPQVTRNAINGATGSISFINWTDLSPSRQWTTLELISASGTVTKQAVAGQSIQLTSVASGTRFRIAACNDLGCGPATERTLVARSSALDLPACPATQRRSQDGVCRSTDNISVPPAISPTPAPARPPGFGQ